MAPLARPKYTSRPHPLLPAGLLKSPQISILSNDDTPDTHLLTPPPTVSERGSGSPPPKTDAEDYLSLGGLGSKRQRGKRHRRKNLLSSEDAGTVSSHTHSSVGSVAESRGSSVHSRNAGTNAAKADGLLPVTQDSAVRQLDKVSLNDGARHVNASKDNTAFDVAVEIASPAVESLRRCSTIGAPEVQSQRRLSQVFKSAFTALFAPDAAYGEISTGTESSTQKDKSKRQSMSYRASDPRRPAPDDRKLPAIDTLMPASITLRKASVMPNVITTGKPRRAGDDSKQPAVDTLMPASISLRKASVMLGLVTTEKTQGVEDDRLDPAPNAAVDSTSDTPYYSLLSFNTDEIGHTAPTPVPTSELAQDRTGRRSSLESLTTTSNMPHLGPYSAVAEPVTANTGMHIARRRSSIKLTDGKLYVPQGTTSHRTSEVHIVSRNSVYEIIWQENDSPTSSSSSELRCSPTQRQHLSDYRGLVLTDASGPSTKSNSKKSSVSGTERQTDCDFSRHVEGTPLDQKDHKQTLFDWTWDRRQSIIDHVTDEQRRTPRSAKMPISKEDSIRPQNRKRSHSITFPRLIDEPFVESFPPLMNRRSTSEWCIPPIVDMNDPMAGRSHRLSSLRETSTEEFAKECGEVRVAFKLPENQSQRLQLDTPIRRISDDRLGSAIGTSSHVRQKSQHPLHTQVVSESRFKHGNAVLRRNRSDTMVCARFSDDAKVDARKKGSISDANTPLASAGPLFVPVGIPSRKQSQVLERTRTLLGGDGAGDVGRPEMKGVKRGERGRKGGNGVGSNKGVEGPNGILDHVEEVARIAGHEVRRKTRMAWWSVFGCWRWSRWKKGDW